MFLNCQTTVYADTNGRTCSEETPCDLQTAVSILNNNDILFINDGDYTLNNILEITVANITIQGESQGLFTSLQQISKMKLKKIKREY